MSRYGFTRREFLSVAGIVSLPALIKSRTTASLTSQDMMVYVGTYTTRGSEGIYTLRMNPASGELKHVKAVKGVVNPSFLAIDSKKRNLYAVNEVMEYQGKPGSAISSFSIDQKTGDLRLLSHQASSGGAPCYITVDKAGRFALAANYGSGSLSVFPIQTDGSLGPATDVVQHSGSSVNRERQEGPHAHCIVLDSTSRYAFAADLGLDKVMIYRFDRAGKLTKNREPWARLKPGAGPRHFTFHPGGRYAYVINELDSTVTTFSWRDGALKEAQTTSTLPKDYRGVNYCADVHVDPAGRFLYGSNRGHNSIVQFAIDGRTGKLTYIYNEPTRGKTPRNFAIDPTGAFLLAANQDSDAINVFRINAADGRLEYTGHSASIPAPVCVKVIAWQ